MSAEKPQVIIVALVGVTGSGKSRMIDVLTGSTNWATNSQVPELTPVRSANVTIEHGKEQINIVLVDTPGIVEEASDGESLRKLQKWLKKNYRNQSYMTGILYLHRITDNREAGIPRCEERILKELCGAQEYGNRLRFVTTMWNKVKNGKDSEAALKREQELWKCNQWSPLLRAGAQSARFDNTKQSAEAIVMELLGFQTGKSVRRSVQDEDVEQDAILVSRSARLLKDPGET